MAEAIVADVGLEFGQCERSVLRAWLEQTLARSDAASAEIEDMSVERSPYASTYAAYVMTLRLTDGDYLKIFLKDFSSYGNGKDQMAARRDREWQVYRDLLAGAELGTARYYGVVDEPALNRLWLVLELVPGRPLRYYEFEWWFGAASWLGTMHGYFARRADVLLGSAFLAKHDEYFFLEMAERAVTTVSHLSPRLAARLAPVLANYDSIVPRMTSGHPTLVHSVHCPSQIMLDIEATPPRYCPIDWELAAVGDGAYDLACLVDGVQSPQLDQMFDLYREAAAEQGFQPPPNDELRQRIDCIQVHRAMNWLARAVERNHSEEHTSELIDLARQRAASVL